jgi:release factor glutamine methyltransferase
VKRNPALKFDCSEEVYAPAEDSELLVESIDIEPGQRVLEIGTGSGFAAAHCAAAGCRVTATDINPAAAACAARNARANGLEIDTIVCDLASAVRGTFDVVLFNPPYLPGKMGQRAADGGAGGVAVASRLLSDLPRLLAPGGKCLIVLSSHSDVDTLIGEHPALAFQQKGTKRLFFEVLSSYEIRATKKH